MSKIIFAFLMLIGATAFAADQKTDAHLKIRKDGAANIEVSKRDVETCARGDGCVLMTNRQIRALIELVNGAQVK